ncbi:MAG TPA: hypothetical protein VFG34_01225 [Sphingopyxis sp.]|nr:hypothetical protein [Sphingopyxis sp.]
MTGAQALGSLAELYATSGIIRATLITLQRAVAIAAQDKAEE